ncbi:MAG: hypothetical protein JWP30_932 [Homoserinimonas sp.]|nr:hypothetical protein [Homoserinimonas sp.]
MDNEALPPITVIDSMLAIAPVAAGKLGHHTVLKSPGARIVVLAFSAGFVMKDHMASKALLIQALDGRMRLSADGQIIDLVPGGLVRLEGSVRHEVEAVEDSRLMLTMIG